MKRTSAFALPTALVLLLLAGCAQPGRPDPSAGAAIEVAHVHGLAYDEATDTVYLATHHGLARGQREAGAWDWAYVGDRYDYMGFTKDTVRPGTFYSSGHPDDPGAFGGVHLGLRRSMDGGVTWEQRSLKGEVDFHALKALHGGEGWLAGFWQGVVKVSRDGGLTWDDKPAPAAGVIGLAASEHAVLAATTKGLFETRDVSGLSNWTRLAGPGSGMVSSVGVAKDGSTIMAGTGDGKAGGVHRSTDAGATWAVVEDPLLRAAAGQVHLAFAANDPGHVFAALGNGTLLESRDAGTSWTKQR